ncbi:MAG: DNA-directed RNA polymerase subunit omega [bacterium]
MTRIRLEDLYKETSNIYEAVSIISKRARQISDEQKLKIESELTPVEEEEVNEEEDESKQLNDTERIERIKQFKKPVSIALQEMVNGNIEYTYATVEDVKDQDKKE